MSAIGRVLLPSLAFALVPSALYCATTDKVEYVGGTVQAIPVNSQGSFNFEDEKALHFNYNGSVYKLAYAQITGTDITRAELRRVHRIPMPSLVPSHWKDILTISFKDSSGAAGSLKFALIPTAAIAARQAIADKTGAPGETAATSNKKQWWGDQYWKTDRNKQAWDNLNSQANSQANQAPQPASGGTN